MERMLSVKAVARILDCSNDTARMRMKGMAGVINVGTERRQQLMVPESGMDDWMRNRRMQEARLTVTAGADGKMARMDRRTGQLKRK